MPILHSPVTVYSIDVAFTGIDKQMDTKTQS